MLRPCPDAEIDDTLCERSFPASASPEHRAWFASPYASSHGFWQAVQYPWTGLGYTACARLHTIKAKATS